MNLVRFLALFLALSVTACAGGGSGGEDGGVAAPIVAETAELDFFGLIVGLTDEQIVPNYRQLSERSLELSDSSGLIESYCNSIGGEDEASALESAQSGWRAAMDAFQASELHRIGPAIEGENPAVERLIHPEDTNFSTCGVDQSVVLGIDPGFDLDTRLANQKGLTALEYLLFNEDLNHNCPSQIPETQDWNLRSEAERKTLRCQHAVRIATDITDAADEILMGWLPEGANFRAEFAHPDNGEASLALLSDALFYIEKDTKDRKLGEPLGLQSNCSSAACPERVESPFSETSLENIRVNLESFRALFTGLDGLSFDDIIASEGFPDIATAFVSEVNAAIALAEEIDNSLLMQANAIESDQLTELCINSAANPEVDQEISACALHGLLKRVTDRLRTDFVTIVNVDIPERAQSDND